MSRTVLFFLREINRFLETLSSFCIFEKALFLDPQDSILERFEHRGSRIESQGSSFECQLTFERYCKYGRRAAFESVRFGKLDLERQTTLNSAESATLCDFGAAADSYGALVMCQT